MKFARRFIYRNLPPLIPEEAEVGDTIWVTGFEKTYYLIFDGVILREVEKSDLNSLFVYIVPESDPRFMVSEFYIQHWKYALPGNIGFLYMDPDLVEAALMAIKDNSYTEIRKYGSEIMNFLKINYRGRIIYLLNTPELKDKLLDPDDEHVISDLVPEVLRLNFMDIGRLI